MNTSHIKSYAPKARTAFIAAMTKRAALFGIRDPASRPCAFRLWSKRAMWP
ncbi:BREX-1 system adenine-specific DNA-methyltransferase PglX [Stutzerimonas stutzeri]|uniref:BREX-1 system adenine-specific DNA-methyltransferase PglX n=1 Tax=Stutzerimonas stutzeri TaxID=316 RepID=UPI00210B8E0B|nr:BREX-1 system adenine-specific DNA-methyltransferase PglX [Stutzerimonas stutzeri]MCQ4322164.1 BREX-1 system adenine-specific DNA-methyltransferase PglX [Stutzerimonas stutzeri]